MPYNREYRNAWYDGVFYEVMTRFSILDSLQGLRKTPQEGNFKMKCGSIIESFIISVELDTSKNVYK